MIARLLPMTIAFMFCATPLVAEEAPPPTAPAQSSQPAPATPEATPKKKPRLNLDSKELPLGGALKTPALWHAYKARFISAQGRVIDTANNLISHSEGQGYGMLLAVAANDRAAFDRIWGWTRANLMVRDDALLAWRWESDKRPAVADINNATDGDMLVAWALAEAGEYWNDMSYRVAGRRIAVELGRKLLIFHPNQPGVILPGISGFHANDRADGPVVNLSYYVFPALARLPLVAPEFDWNGLVTAGLRILDLTRTSDEALPADWISLKSGASAKPAEGFPPHFAYNAVRIPLYLAWAGIGEREQYEPFMALVRRTRGALAVVDISNGKEVARFGDSGVGAIGALTACVVEGAKAPAQFFTPNGADNYYPATLHLLSVVAAQMRYPACLR